MQFKQLFLSAVSSAFCVLAHGQVSNLTATLQADSYTSMSFPTVNYGLVDTLSLKTTTGAYNRVFLKFDLSSIPASAVIISAKLTLTPKGTEGVVSNSDVQLDLVNSTWTESGTGSITHNSLIAGNLSFVAISGTSIAGPKREFDVASYVQLLIEGRFTNYGFRLRRIPENGTTNTRYYSKEAATGNRPQLLIQYYTPLSVSAATIVHASTLSSSDGSITPTVINGSSTVKTYKWYNSSGTLLSSATSLSGLGYGWYGLKVYGSGAIGDTLYQAFLVGAQCEDVSISFNPGPNYIVDAYVNDLVATGVDNKQINFGSSVSLCADSWLGTSWYHSRSLLKFNIWVDPSLGIPEAVMNLAGKDHNPFSRVNTSEFVKVTANWRENGVAHINLPTVSTSITVAAPAQPAGNSAGNLDIAPFFNSWKTNNTLNYGMLFRLIDYSNVATRQQYYSSDAALVNSPSVNFRVNLQSSLCNYSSHTLFERELDGSFVKAVNGTVKFYFDEEYAIESGKKIPLTLYNENNLVVAAIDMNGAAVSGAPLLPAIIYKAGDNRDTLNLSTYGLTSGKFYVLQLTNSIGEKRYIKFQYN